MRHFDMSGLYEERGDDMRDVVRWKDVEPLIDALVTIMVSADDSPEDAHKHAAAALWGAGEIERLREYAHKDHVAEELARSKPRVM